MEIKILGTGCPNCLTMEKLVRRVVEQHQIKANITMIKDIMDIMSYGVMSTPALVINEKVLVKGRVPREAEIMELINLK